MESSNFTTQSAEDQAREEFLRNQEFQTVDINSGSSGKKLTFNKVNSFIQQLATGLNAANMYNAGGTTYPNQYTPPATVQPAQKSGFPPVLGVVVVGAGIAYLVKMMNQ